MINFLAKFANKLDNKKIALIILVCLTIVYLDFTFIFKLQLQGIRNSKAKIVKLKEGLETLNKDLIIMQQTPAKQETNIKPKEVIIEGKLPLLLQEISDIANQFDVKIMQIKTAQDTKSQEEIIAPVKLSAIFINLDLSSGYHSLGGFINGLENSKRFIAVKELRITRSPSDYLRQSVSLVLKTYVKK